MTPKIRWFHDRTQARAFDAAVTGELALESRVQLQDTWPGDCSACLRPTAFTVCTDARFSGRANLREGLRCARCRLTARQRLMLLALGDSVDPHRGGPGALLERFSRLHRAVRRAYPRTRGSEFLSAAHRPGQRDLWRSASRPWLWRPVRHESITQLSYADRSLAFIAHSDVLEHVDDTMAAVHESRRVLAAGGVMVFTVPLALHRDHSVRRGHLDASGLLVERLPSEYHGNGLDKKGVYTFHNFGWELIEQLRNVFARVDVGIIHAPSSGLMHADSVRGDWAMSPIVVRAFTAD